MRKNIIPKPLYRVVYYSILDSIYASTRIKGELITQANSSYDMKKYLIEYVKRVDDCDEVKISGSHDFTNIKGIKTLVSFKLK
jgi:hypothetical protein